MSRYRKKPVEIEAMQWDGTAKDAGPIINWILSSGMRSARYYEPDEYDNCGAKAYHPPRIAIDTLEGTITASPGDYIIQGVQGEHYPCKPDIFEATYEKVED